MAPTVHGFARPSSGNALHASESPCILEHDALLRGDALSGRGSCLVCRYDFDSVHSVAKQFGSRVDNFLYGFDVLNLLLWTGNLAAAREGVAKVLDAHRQVFHRVGDGTVSASE